MRKISYEKSLEFCYPETAKQWHPTKNGGKKPSDFGKSSGEKVWWLLPYDDPETGKHFDFEWQQRIAEKTHCSFECPFFSNQMIWPGYNDLETKRPDLAKQWHPTKNGDLLPSMVAPNSKTEVWWYYPYDDPETGKHFDFEWLVKIKRRTRGDGCPFLSGKAVWKGYNDLETRRPDVAKLWHPTKNGGLLPSMVTVKSDVEVWWFLPYDDPETGKHFDFEWQQQISVKTRCAYECPVFSGQMIWPGYNDLETKRPDLAKQWHPTKNGDLLPSMVAPNSKTEVWWYYPYDDPKTGKHYDFEWVQSAIERNRTKGECPFITGHRVWPGYNDVETCYPKVAEEWHPRKNGKLLPSMISFASHKRVWWYLPYDDPKTGKHFDFEWSTTVKNRTLTGSNCPFILGRRVWPGFNDLETLYPEIAAEWHPTKNGKKGPQDYTSASGKSVWWYLPYDDPKTGKHFDFEWKACIRDRTKNDVGCPFISGHKIWPGYNDLATLYPSLAAEWHPIKNGKYTAQNVGKGTVRKFWWLRTFVSPNTGDVYNIEWRDSPNNRINKGANCEKQILKILKTEGR